MGYQPRREEIHLITDWRNPRAGYINPNSEKVPTLISYNGSSCHWGFEADDTAAKRWFKVMLDPQHEYAQSSDVVVNCQTTVEDAKRAAIDYLRELWSYAQSNIQNHIGEEDDEIHFEVVLTVPAVWSPTAKERTRKIAKDAGLPSAIHIVSELEAAVIAVFYDKVRDGDTFRVCGTHMERFDSEAFAYDHIANRRTTSSLFVTLAGGLW